MNGGRVALLAALALTAGAPLRAQSPGLGIRAASGPPPLASCAGRLTAKTKGIAAVRAVCPDIDQMVASLGLGAVLPGDWTTRLGARALADLSALEVRYSGPPPSARPRDALLRSIASRLNGQTGARSWWQRVVAWLARVLEPQQDRQASWVRGMPAWLLDARAWWWARQITMGLIVVTLVMIVLREAHAAGRLRGAANRPKAPARARRRAGTAPSDADHTAEPQLTGAQLHPAALLRVLIDALRRSRRIDHDRSLTCRELSERARFDSRAQREGFARIALLAEEELYGPQGGVAQVPDELRDGAETLREQLLRTPPAAPTAVS